MCITCKQVFYLNFGLVNEHLLSTTRAFIISLNNNLIVKNHIYVTFYSLDSIILDPTSFTPVKCRDP